MLVIGVVVGLVLRLKILIWELSLMGDYLRQIHGYLRIYFQDKVFLWSYCV
jgi:hypothetical protein